MRINLYFNFDINPDEEPKVERQTICDGNYSIDCTVAHDYDIPNAIREGSEDFARFLEIARELTLEYQHENIFSFAKLRAKVMTRE